MGIFAPKEAYLAGFCPRPVDRTFPNITWSIRVGSNWVYYKSPYILKDDS